MHSSILFFIIISYIYYRSAVNFKKIKKLTLFKQVYQITMWRKIRISTILIPLCVFLSVIYLHANNYGFELISDEKGLTSSVVTSCFQDNNGYIWIGSFDGLHRYDGYEIKNHFRDTNNPFTINTKGIIAMTHDKNGDIWFAAQGRGINRYDTESDIFYSVYEIKYKGKSYALDVVSDIECDEEGNIWFVALNRGLFVMDTSFNMIDAFVVNEKMPFSNLPAFDMDKHAVWCGTDMGTIIKLKKDFSSYKEIKYSDKKETVRDMLSDSRGDLYFGTSHGIYSIDKGTEKITNYSTGKYKGKIVGKEFRGLAEDKNGNILMASDGEGLFIFNPSNDRVNHLQNRKHDPRSLPSSGVRDVIVDKDGNIWLALYGSGLGFNGHYKNKFDPYVAGSDPSKSLVNDYVKDFVEDRNENVYIGTSKGISCLDFKNMEFSLLGAKDKAPPSVLNANANSIMIDGSKLYIGTYLDGLIVYDLDRNKLDAHYRVNENNTVNGLGENSIFLVKKLSDGVIFLGYLYNGFGFFDTKTKTFKNFNPVEKYPGSNLLYRLSDIYEDKYGKIWIASLSMCLNKYDRENETFSSYHLPESVDDSLVNFNGYDIFEDQNGTVWLGTSKGLRQIDIEEDRIVNFSEDKIFKDNKFRSINGTKNKLWTGIKGVGLMEIDLNDKSYRIFDEFQDLIGLEFNRNANLKHSSGKILMGTNYGFIKFDPNINFEKYPKPKVVLTGISVNGNSIRIKKNTDSSSTSYVSFSSVENLEFDHKDKSISFYFTGIEYNSPQSITYQYKLEGFDNNWITTDAKNRFATYTNLPGGEYRFLVKAANKDGIWSSDDIEIDVKINPPFWNTIWFLVLMIIVAIIIVILIYLYRISQLQKQRKYLQEKVEEKTYELTQNNRLLLSQREELNETNTILEERQQRIEEQAEELLVQKDNLSKTTEQLAKMNEELQDLNNKKNRFFSIIAHDLKNPFNTLIGFTEMLKLKGKNITDDKRNRYISAIYESSVTIFRLLENLLLWARSQTDRIKFSPEVTLVYRIIEEVLKVQKDNYEQKSLDINVNCDDLIQAVFDPTMINTVIRNLFSNAIKFTPENGTIEISCHNDGNMFEFIIKDTGMGMSEEVKESLFRIDKSVTTAGTKGEKGTGLGLIICKEFIDLHNGKIWVDKSDEKGTVIKFTLPQNQI